MGKIKNEFICGWIRSFQATGDDETFFTTNDTGLNAIGIFQTLILAKAPYQVSDDLVAPLLSDDPARFVRQLAWASFAGARGFIGTVARRLGVDVAPVSSRSA